MTYTYKHIEYDPSWWHLLDAAIGTTVATGIAYGLSSVAPTTFHTPTPAWVMAFFVVFFVIAPLEIEGKLHYQKTTEGDE